MKPWGKGSRQDRKLERKQVYDCLVENVQKFEVQVRRALCAVGADVGKAANFLNSGMASRGKNVGAHGPALHKDQLKVDSAPAQNHSGGSRFAAAQSGPQYEVKNEDGANAP